MLLLMPMAESIADHLTDTPGIQVAHQVIQKEAHMWIQNTGQAQEILKVPQVRRDPIQQ